MQVAIVLAQVTLVLAQVAGKLTVILLHMLTYSQFNVDQVDVEVEAPTKGLLTDSSIKVEHPRIHRKPLNWGFRPNASWASVGTTSIFCRVYRILSHCATCQTRCTVTEERRKTATL